MRNITYGTFLFFGSSLVAGILVVIFFVPETMGLSLEEMDILFNVSGFAHGKRQKTDKIIQDMRAAESLAGPDVKNNVILEQTEDTKAI